MKNMIRVVALVALMSALVAGCGKSEDEAQNNRTPEPRVRQLRSQVLVFARAHFQKCHYSSANCSGAAGLSIPKA